MKRHDAIETVAWQLALAVDVNPQIVMLSIAKHPRISKYLDAGVLRFAQEDSEGLIMAAIIFSLDR